MTFRRSHSGPPRLLPPIEPWRLKYRHGLLLLLPFHVWLVCDGWRIRPSTYWAVVFGVVFGAVAVGYVVTALINRHRLNLLPRGWYWTANGSIVGAVNHNAVLVFRYRKGPNRGTWGFRYKGRLSEYVYPQPEEAVVAALEATV